MPQHKLNGSKISKCFNSFRVFMSCYLKMNGTDEEATQLYAPRHSHIMYGACSECGGQEV